jgi:hypothetical protein
VVPFSQPLDGWWLLEGINLGCHSLPACLQGLDMANPTTNKANHVIFIGHDTHDGELGPASTAAPAANCVMRAEACGQPIAAGLHAWVLAQRPTSATHSFFAYMPGCSDKDSVRGFHPAGEGH